jgi:hypothetical protein
MIQGKKPRQYKRKNIKGNFAQSDGAWELETIVYIVYMYQQGGDSYFDTTYRNIFPHMAGSMVT